MLTLLKRTLGLERGSEEPSAPPTPKTPPHPPAPDDAPLVMDPLFGDAHAHRLRAELQAGRFESVEEFMRTITEPDDRTFYVQVLSEWPGKPDWVGAWMEQRPASAWAHLMCGMHGVHWAWEARGFGFSDTVTEEGGNLFLRRLEDADRLLQQAATLDPADATPWALMLRSAYGLGLDEEERFRRFHEAVKRAPDHRVAHSSMLQSLCAKWYGSHAKMFRFVSERTSQCGPGSAVHAIVAEAHIERYWPAVEDKEPIAENYWRQPTVRSAIAQAAHAYYDAPSFRSNRDTPRTRNVFAWCLASCGLAEAASRQFEAIGPYVAPTTWGFYHDPLQQFSRTRAWALDTANAVEGG